jgi:hypothetical protein
VKLPRAVRRHDFTVAKQLHRTLAAAPARGLPAIVPHHKDPGAARPSRSKSAFCPAPGQNEPIFSESARTGADIHWLPDHKRLADNARRFFPKFAVRFQRYLKTAAASSYRFIDLPISQ